MVFILIFTIILMSVWYYGCKKSRTEAIKDEYNFDFFLRLSIEISDYQKLLKIYSDLTSIFIEKVVGVL